MSTWTSKAVLLLAALGLAACDGAMVTRSAPEKVRLDGGFVVAGPRGFCIDSATVKDQGAATVVVLGSCAAIARNALLPRPAVPGVVTVSVEGAPTGALPTDLLERYVMSPAGRAALAADGRAGSVTILETRRVDDALLLHAIDKSAARRPDTAEDTWRALFAVEGRFVSVALRGLSNRPIPRSEGLQTLAAQVTRMRAENDG